MMGGSGGGGFADWDQAKYERLRREAEQRTRDAAVEAEVNEYLQKILSSVTTRDIDTISRRLGEIEECLGDDIDGLEKTLFGGSVAKHTYVDGLSDVDSLVIIERETIEGLSPGELLRRFRDVLHKRLPPSEVDSVVAGKVAVTVKYKDGTEIQLLPAYETPSGYAISDGQGQAWKNIDPRRFAEQLTRANSLQKGKLVPTIKLAKAIVDTFPRSHQLSGYHLEALAVRGFQQYNGPRTYREMLSHLFSFASDAVRQPMRDPTGQSKHIDEYLGGRGSAGREMVADSLERMARRVKAWKALQLWQDLLEG